MLDHIINDYNVDKTSIYVAGFSNGGGLAGLLACDSTASSRIAAFAASSGAFYKDEALKEPLFSRCHPSRQAIPMLDFHGDTDPVIHYDGKTTPDGPTYNIFSWIQGWAHRNGCPKGDNGKMISLYGGKVKKTVWTCGGAEDVVEHYKIAGFGHGWPTTFPLNNDEQRHGPTYFNATPIVLDFFQRFRLDSTKSERQEL